jgi:4-diphosphocytidyl-2-C-methyl-D-erythritol kinase
MRIEQRAKELVVWAPAKVNLYLEVLGKRGDGYHEIATLMLTIGLYDTLRFMEEDSGGVRLSCNLPTLSTGPDNLIVRAAELLRRHTGCTRGVAVHLDKRIPLAGGLAGGSTNAAAALVALNRLWGLSLGRQELSALCAELGSDIAFFLVPPAAWCTGRGEKVEPVPLTATLWLVLLCPPVGLSTPDVYRRVRPPTQPQTGIEIRQALLAGDVTRLGTLLHNRLQEPAEALCPNIARWRHRLTRANPAGTLLSGSGSTLFALCRDSREAARIAQDLRDDPDLIDSRVYMVRSCA